MVWTRYKPSQRGWFIGLLVLSALALCLPPRWSDAFKHVVQIMVPAEDLLYAAGHRTVQSMKGIGEEHASEQMEREALVRALAAQCLLAEQLRKEMADLQALREGCAPLNITILPAKVVARDIVASRDSLLVEQGSYRGIGWRDWVASHVFVQQGYENGVDPGQAVLTRECLLGRVEQVSPYMCRVQLLSDVDSPPIEVHVGAVVDGKPRFVDYACSLHGRGRQEMVIKDVPYKYVQADAEGGPEEEAGRIRLGDLVFSAPGQLGLPVPLIIGRVAAFETNPKTRLVHTVVVEPAVEIEDVRDVYIIPIVPVSRLAIHDIAPTRQTTP